MWLNSDGVETGKKKYCFNFVIILMCQNWKILFLTILNREYFHHLYLVDFGTYNSSLYGLMPLKCCKNIIIGIIELI